MDLRETFVRLKVQYTFEPFSMVKCLSFLSFSQFLHAQNPHCRIFLLEKGQKSLNLTLIAWDLEYMHWQFTRKHGKGEDHLFSSLILPNTDKHSDIYLILCMWDDYHEFWIPPLVITKLLIEENYQLGKLLNYLILDFVIAIWHGKLVVVNLHRLSPKYCKRTG